MLAIGGTWDSSSNSNLSYLRTRPTSAASLRTANFVEQLDASIHYALSGKSSDQSNDPPEVTSAIEQAFQAALHNHGFDSQISHTGQHLLHADGQGRHAARAAAGAGLTAAPDFSTLFSPSGGRRVSARDASTASGTSHSGPDMQTLLRQLNQAPQQFLNNLFLALLRSPNATLNQDQAVQSIQTGENVNLLG